MATPAGWQSNSSYNTTAQMVRITVHIRGTHLSSVYLWLVFIKFTFCIVFDCIDEKRELLRVICWPVYFSWDKKSLNVMISCRYYAMAGGGAFISSECV